jgi:hypothetical protein
MVYHEAESVFLVADSRRTSEMQNTQKKMVPQKSQQVAALACDLNPRETKTKRRYLLCRQCPTSSWYLHWQFILSLLTELILSPTIPLQLILKIKYH